MNSSESLVQLRYEENERERENVLKKKKGIHVITPSRYMCWIQFWYTLQRTSLPNRFLRREKMQEKHETKIYRDWYYFLFKRENEEEKKIRIAPCNMYELMPFFSLIWKLEQWPRCVEKKKY